MPFISSLFQHVLSFFLSSLHYRKSDVVQPSKIKLNSRLRKVTCERRKEQRKAYEEIKIIGKTSIRYMGPKIILY